MACVAQQEGGTEQSARSEHLRFNTNHAWNRVQKFSEAAGSKVCNWKLTDIEVRLRHPPYPMRMGWMPTAARGRSLCPAYPMRTGWAEAAVH